ncbi:MAG: M23 family metallopeptidase [Chrysiogenales bacterium]|nr:MAG: M23 family metallopeptidase [Chrysiogenales bacterium]
MKKYATIAVVLSFLAFASLALSQIILGQGRVDDPMKLEDAIIIHGIRMESDTPPADQDDDGEGQIIYDDSFGDTVIDYGRLKKVKKKTEVWGLGSFEKLKKEDSRWHLQPYTIRKNDNIWKIARRFGVHQHVIISVNGITNPDMVKPGKRIKVPSRAGTYYIVKKGDTASGIAKRHKTDISSILSHNGIRGDVIRIGQRLFLPGVEQRPAPSVSAAARSKRTMTVATAGGMRFFWPIRGRVTSGFGNRRDPFSGKREFHCGVDISANVGTPIRSAANGRVIFSGWKDGYGKVVIVRHEGGYITVYAHNSINLAVEDTMVKQGEVIARSGMTGAVTGAHLHFELRKYINPLNPLRFLK